MKRAITLMELILASVLLMTIILSATSLDIATRYFFKSSDLKTKVLNEASLITEHIAKSALFSVGEGGLKVSADDGDITKRAFSVSADGKRLKIRQDLRSDNNYYQSLDTPQNFNNDRCVKYVFDSTAHTVTYYKYSSHNCTGNPLQSIILTKKLMDLSAGEYLSYNAGANPFRIAVFLKLRHNPAKAADPKANPEVELKTALFVH